MYLKDTTQAEMDDLFPHTPILVQKDVGERQKRIEVLAHLSDVARRLKDSDGVVSGKDVGAWLEDIIQALR